MAKPQVGETWAYRIGRKSGKPVSQVKVVGMPVKRRAVIEHVDGELAGEQEDVPLQRLVVPWEVAGKLLEDERNLLKVYETPWGDYGDLELEAVLTIAQGAFDYPIYSVNPWPEEPARGTLEAKQLPVLATAVGMSQEDLLTLPNAFVDRKDVYHAPFVAAVEITKRYCQHDPENVLAGTRLLQEQMETLAATAHLPFSGTPVPHAYAVENLRMIQPALNLLRSWCGEGAFEEWNELEELRAEIERLQTLIGDIAFQIAEAGNETLANRLLDIMLHREQEPGVDLFPAGTSRK